MKYSIGKKLLASGFIVLMFVLLMVVVNQIVVNIFNNTSKLLVTEYNELDALQELKLSLGKLQISANNYSVFGKEQEKENFRELSLNALENLNLCRSVITDRHELNLLNDFEVVIYSVDSLVKEIFQNRELGGDINNKFLLESVSYEIHIGTQEINILLNETKLEIDEYEKINKTLIKHSTLTVFSLGLIIMLILISGGLIFIRSLTKPIKELVSTTHKIINGDRSSKVNIKTRDEFSTLADSFNQMVDTLDRTTVSRNYLDNILKNMFDSLVVIDNQLIIQSVNQAALNLLGYKKSNLEGQSLMKLFRNKDKKRLLNTISGKSLQKKLSKINAINYLLSKSGKEIPMLLSCAILKNEINEISGIIMTGHDLTEKKAIEKKLDQTRKDRLIDINEAQEEERIRIATDLHDGLGQTLTAISYSIQELFSDDGEKGVNSGQVKRIQHQIDLAIKEAKNIAYDLIPIVLKDFGLIVAIENLINRANELYETRFRFNAFDFNERIDARLEKTLYRICQEAINNIVKHSNAKEATCQIFWQNCMIVLVIEDDGDGFDTALLEQDKSNTGIGLISIKERALAFDGNFTINSEPGNGAELLIEIPCRKNKHNENS